MFPAEKRSSSDGGIAENEGDCKPYSDHIGRLDIKQVINIPAIQDMMNYFFELTHVGMAITDMDGNILVAIGWQDICTKFHRCHPQTLKNCIDSDTYITRDPAEGKFTLYKCRNNMWDMATPLYVGGQHVANLFLGQFFFDDEVPDYDLFRARARKYGFDVDEYMAALDRVPRWSREKVRTAMEFYTRLAGMINTLSYNNVQLQNTLRERQIANEALQENELRLKKTQEIAHLGSWELDLVNNTLSWSDEAYRIFGLQPGEFGATYDAFLAAVHPDDRAAVDAAYFGSIREGKDTYEIEHRVVRVSDGEVRTVHEKCQHFRDASGRIIRSVGMVHDITERKRIEDALRESERKFRAIFDQTFQYTGLMTPDGTLIEANRSALEIIGAEEADVIGRPFWDTPWWTHSRQLQEILRQAIEKAAQGEFVRFELDYHAADGSLRCIDFSIKPVMDEAGHVAMLIPEGRDITGRKQIERDLIDAKARAELYLDLMGHDINNMHQIALGYLELARDLPGDAGQQKLLDKPVEVLQRSTRLINNVRKLQKLQDGGFQASQVDACQMLSGVKREYGAMPGKEITLNLNGYEHCYVLANELLYDVFSNLVSNAIKHTGDRADIAISLEVTGEIGDRYCLVTVEDNGRGVPDDFKDRIFNRMLKGTHKAKGIGLGLYLVKTLVESYGGRVWVEDRVPGDHTKGAKFVVMLPVTE